MTNQAKEKAMRKGSIIKDLTSSNVVLVKPSQDCQTKMENYSDEEFRAYCQGRDDEFRLQTHLKQKLQEQAKEMVKINDLNKLLGEYMLQDDFQEFECFVWSKRIRELGLDSVKEEGK